jgi:hypothetical protein
LQGVAKYEKISSGGAGEKTLKKIFPEKSEECLNFFQFNIFFYIEKINFV